MTVDRQKVLDAFAAYIRPYDAQDPKVSLKIHHTYRVAALCEQIGRSIALEGTALDLAWLCGMLHDVGRFEQLRRFGTFDDSKSIDHARAGVQVLFEQGHIRDYLDDDSEDAMLRTAVEWHSAYRLPDGLDERTTTGHSRIWEVARGDIHEHDLDPRDLGIPLAELSDLIGGSAEHHGNILRRTLAGSMAPVRDILLRKAAARLAAQLRRCCMARIHPTRSALIPARTRASPTGPTPTWSTARPGSRFAKTAPTLTEAHS